MIEVNNIVVTSMCVVYSKLMIKTSGRGQWRPSDVFINFEQIPSYRFCKKILNLLKINSKDIRARSMDIFLVSSSYTLSIFHRFNLKNIISLMFVLLVGLIKNCFIAFSSIKKWNFQKINFVLWRQLHHAL